MLHGRRILLRELLMHACRGVGENVWLEGVASASQAIIPGYRENTVRSFKRAAELGVDFVEFDVQARDWSWRHCQGP